MRMSSGKIEVSLAAVMMIGGATVVATGLVFLLGIYVGKGMVEERLGQDGRVVRQPAAPPGTGGGDDLTFWNRLDKGQTPAPGPAEATPRLEETPVRLPPAVAAAAKPVEAAPTPEPTATEVARAAPTAVPPRIEGGDYQVQVNAMADKARADQLLQDLRGLGYEAQLSTAKLGSRTLYRVRVVGLASAEAAKQAVTKLRDQGYPRAFVVAEVNR